MGGGGEGGDVRQLDLTPTWAVAAVCAVIVIISILLEKVIHKFAKVRYSSYVNVVTLFFFFVYGFFLIYVMDHVNFGFRCLKKKRSMLC